ncbi:carbohydrate-binding domain-containing protein [Roseococcus sp.]|uniref:carbohydrate-binding domain-containing protein n=1 Tax=Roseococcus sp. TaxID=2109646 RepID=UPI003BA9DE57
MDRPAIAAGASLDVTLATAAPKQVEALDLAQALAGHSFHVDMAVHGGEHVTVDVLAALKVALADGTASFWQQGELTSQARVEVPLDGSQRFVFDVTVFKGGGISVDAQFNNDGAMGANGGRVAYDIAVTMDGRQALSASVDQGQYQNWHESFSSNATDGGQETGSPEAGWLNIRQDVAHLQAAGVVAGYDLTLNLDTGLLAAFGEATHAAGWGEPFATNGVTQFMPGTGGRADIGITTEANTSWLISQDPRAAAYALGQAEAASSVPWNFWDSANGTWLSTDDYPNLWTDGRGGTGTPGDATSGGLTQQVDGQTGWHTDSAHQPNLSFVPYVLTGARWMLDNLEAQAAWNILAQQPSVRGDDSDNLINTNQVRGAAWALREVDNAAWAAPDGSAEKAYFQEASDANYAWLVSKIPEWTALQGEAHGWVPGSYGADGALPPWQQDYFASTVIAAASRGNADALTFLEWQSNFLVGRFTHAAEGFDAHDGAAYLLAISDATEGAALYQSWAEIGAQTDARGWSNNDGWSQSQGDYAQLAVATLAGIYRLTGSAEAKAAYEALMADGAPFTGRDNYEHDPTFAIAWPDAVGVTPLPRPDTPEVIPPPVEEIPLPEVPVAPAPVDGTVALAVVLGAESWAGNPIAVIRVDGEEVFRGEVAAQHAAGGQRYELGNFAANAAHTVTVDYVNDAWGGTSSTDRNLYVESVLVNGVASGFHQDLLQNGQAAFELTAAGSVGAPQQDVLRIALSGDAWQGDARYAVLIDGKQVAEGTTWASHAAGQQEVLEFKGDFTGGEHALTIRFLNDSWGGTADTDRNLYVDGVTLNGVDQHFAASLLTNLDQNFALGAVKQPGSDALPENTAPGGAQTVLPDVLRIAVSQDAYQGDARYLIMVDGVQMGGEHAASASHGSGNPDVIEVQGDFAGGGHALTVRFLNDAWGGDANSDRNLYVDAVELNGVDQNAHAALLQNGDAVFAF